jgi:hypothetical protein
MPACRGVYLTHPQSGLPGLWIELSTDPAGTLTGMLATAWPAVGAQNLATYQTLLNTTYRDLCTVSNLVIRNVFGVPPPGWYIGSDGGWYPKIVDIAITLSSITPVTISNVIINEGAIRSYRL